MGGRRARGFGPVTDAHQRWTQTNNDELRCDVAGGEQIEAIADALERTVKDTRAIAQRLCLRAEPNGTSVNA